jgi:hypothetical protein
LPPSISSASVTLAEFLLATSNFTVPAGTSAGLGAQSLSVMETETVELLSAASLALAPESPEPEEPVLSPPQAVSSRPAAATVAAQASTRR